MEKGTKGLTNLGQEQSIIISDLPNPSLRIFISHYFGEDDFPATLVQILREKNIAGYLAKKVKKYEIGIDQKIKDAILQSDYLVPILTNNGLGSPSVNQEIGFAIGNNIPVIVMIEEKSKLGVFIHGREPEVFTKETFQQSCSNVAEYLVREGKKRVNASTTTYANEFLTKRRLVDPEREEFTINPISDQLHDMTMKKEHAPNTAKRLVLFSACPRHLLDDVEVVSEQTRKWIRENGVVKLGDYKFNIIPPIPQEKIGLNSLTYKWIMSERFTRYLEFQNNGYLEQGMTYPIIRDVHFRDNNDDLVPALHLNWVTGAYWGFLLFARNYYKMKQISNEITVSFNVHNTRDLMLFGFGARFGNLEWTDPTRTFYDGQKPETELLNVHLPDTINMRTTDDEIARIVQKVSERLSNAYGLSSSRCYHDDGTFNFNLFSHYGGFS